MIYLHSRKASCNNLISKAEQFAAAGRELAARQELATALSQVEKSLPEPVVPEKEAETSYRISSEIMAGIPIESRDLIVTTITKKLSQAAIDFNTIKRDITNTLAISQQIMNQQAPAQARPSLEAVIKQLDNAILRSDFMLYTDMGTEKKLLQASAQLHEARKLLGKGEHAKASELVGQVRTTMDRLIFQPSDVRMKHFVSGEIMQLEELPLRKQLANTLEQPLQSMRQDPSARQAFEYIRSLGLTYDAETALSLTGKENIRPEMDNSVKSILLKMMQSEADQTTARNAEQALQHITGQQLLSKTDSTGLQSMLLSLPIMLQDQIGKRESFYQLAK